MQFLKYKNDIYPNGYWWLIIEGNGVAGESVVLQNRSGRCFTYTVKENDIFCEADCWHALDWHDVLVEPDSPYGYIAPDGSWIGCRFHDHQDLCDFVLDISMPEEYGWVKVYQSGREIKHYARRRFLNEAQLKTLREKTTIELSE